MDEIGNRYGYTKVIRKDKDRSGKGKGLYWICMCACGKEHSSHGGNLRRGIVQSCGCGIVQRRHGHTDNTGWRSPTYLSWYAMKQRCLNKNHKFFKNYGQKGITICQRWLDSFEDFLKDMGERPKDYTLDRIDPRGDYSPSNCRWADWATQGANRIGGT